MRKHKGDFYLFLTALILGSAMIFQKMGMKHIHDRSTGADPNFMGTAKAIGVMG